MARDNLVAHFEAYSAWRGQLLDTVDGLRHWLNEQELNDAQTDLRIQHGELSRFRESDGSQPRAAPTRMQGRHQAADGARASQVPTHDPLVGATRDHLATVGSKRTGADAPNMAAVSGLRVRAIDAAGAGPWSGTTYQMMA